MRPSCGVHDHVMRRAHTGWHPRLIARPVTQYVHPCRPGLIRIVKHGRRWRALLDERELGRHESAETAVLALRTAWPRARLPASLQHWRQLPALKQIG
jgi:hypothetical protein